MFVCVCVWFPGLQNGLLLQEPHRPRETPDQERRGDSRHRVGRVPRGRRAGGAKPLQVHDAEAAEGEDPVAHLAQQLPKGQRSRALPQRGRQPQDQDHGAMKEKKTRVIIVSELGGFFFSLCRPALL